MEKEKKYSAQLVIAALNEAPGIGLTIAEMTDTLGQIEVLVVDGKSTDRTAEIASNMGAKVFFQDGKGKGNAIAKALQHIDSTLDYIILTDADFTYPTDKVPEMIKILDQNPEVGMVCGNRLNGDVDESALHRIFHTGNQLLSFVHRALNGVELQDPLTGLRVMRREALQNWRIKSDGFDIEVELNQHILRQGYSICEVPIGYRARLGKKKLKPIHGLEILKRMLKETTY
jgi:dolichol-phosphate mannosyltransferase